MSLILLPNSTGCVARKGYDAGPRPPNALQMDSETLLDSAELNVISTDDDNCVAGIGVPTYGGGLRVSFKFGTQAVQSAEATAKCYGVLTGAPPCPVYGEYMYVWNNPTSEYVLRTSNTASSKSTLTSDLTAYVYQWSGNYYVQVLLMAKDCDEQTGASVSTSNLYYAQIEYTLVTPKHQHFYERMRRQA